MTAESLSIFGPSQFDKVATFSYNVLMRNKLDLNHTVMIVIGNESVINMSFDEFRRYCIQHKDTELCAKLLERHVVEQGSSTFILE